MAVYKRSYRGYSGTLTPLRSRFWVITRYANRQLFHSRLLTAFFVACFVYPLGCIAWIYLLHNLTLLEQLRLPIQGLFVIDGKFFLQFMGAQGTMAFLLTAFVGPSLISADLANQALPLYLCRPLTRAEYVLGKMCVIWMLLSYVTWVPGLILFLIQGSLEGWMWTRENLWIASGVLLGSWIWILVLSMVSLALSAWIKWKLAARALLVGIFFVGAGMAEAINEVGRTHWGSLVDLLRLIGTVWGDLLRVPVFQGTEISVRSAWIVLGAVCVFSLALLARRIRAYEVVR